jgi:hypothetical protein
MLKQRSKTHSCRIERRMMLRLPLAILILIFQFSPLVAATIPNTLSEVRGFNYTPASAQRSWDMWLQFNAQEVDRDFGYANELRLNQTRVFLPFAAWQQDPKTFSASLASFMDVAYKHHIGVMLVLVPYMGRSGVNDIAPGDLDARMQTWIKAVAEIVKAKPSMAFWDVQNEPDFQGSREHPRTREDLARRMHLARMFADTVHEVDKVHPTTVGCTYEKCMEDTAAFADVLSFHDYSPTVAQIDENLSRANAFAARAHKPFFNTELGCIGRANPYDVILREYYKAHVGFYIWELMITHYWGNVHGVFYPDGTVRDPSIAAALLGIFRNRGPNVVLEDPDRESWVTTAVADGKAWLASPNPDWNDGLRVVEIEANLLEAAQLVPMRILPTRTVYLLRAGKPDIPALRSAISQYVGLLEPYIDPQPVTRHW